MKRRIILNLTTQYILSQVSEEEIFAKYVCEVDYENLIRNPMRNDIKPTASFYVNSKNRIVFHDFNGYFHGDCFAAVQKMFGGMDFTKMLRMIANDFNITKSDNVYTKKVYEERKQKAQAKIEIRVQDWTEVDKQYWKSHSISSNTLTKYYVKSISHLWINGKINYIYKEDDPGYAYYFGNGFYKIYFPLRKEFKFITNTNNLIIQGYDQLPESYDFLVIAKSLKDVLIYSTLGVPAIAPQAEGNTIPETIINLLKERFPIIISNYDFDYAGIRGANKLKREFGIPALFLTNGKFNTINYGAKDIADYVRINGLEKTKELISEIYNTYII